ncbi:cilia- and flagella-associated protein 45-like [Ptychodera flava]|uniref:cilia- and flagella-associated protein 45-like n=1 Tax=Ptychodera flava TaxID=63121 RepID=UPI003969C3D3
MSKSPRPSSAATSGDEDSDYDLDGPPKEFNMNTKGQICQKVHINKIKVGIRRHPGHYTIGTLRFAPEGGSLIHYYNGKHWEVDLGDKPLERSTRRLTISAVHESLDDEQRRRIAEERETMQRASITLRPLNKEFKRAISKSQDMYDKQIMKQIQDQEDLKDEAQSELIWKANKKVIDEQIEEERERRSSILSAMIHGDKDETDDEFKAIVHAMAETNRKWNDVQDDLMGAISELEDVRLEEDHEIDERCKELKDNFVACFNRASALIKLQLTEESEKRRRKFMSEDPNLDYDALRRRSMFFRDLAQQEMIRVFAGVMHDDTIKEETSIEQTRKTQEMLLEQMVRSYNAKEADHEMAEERARRIMEAEGELAGEIDAIKEDMKDIMVRVQEQMLLLKFHGHKVKAPRYHESYDFQDAESERDHKLRTMRLQSRRKSCVVTD